MSNRFRRPHRAITNGCTPLGNELAETMRNDFPRDRADEPARAGSLGLAKRFKNRPANGHCSNSTTSTHHRMLIGVVSFFVPTGKKPFAEQSDNRSANLVFPVSFQHLGERFSL